MQGATLDAYTRVSGVVHVHTTLSDGAATPEEVIAAARASGLKFVVITDHKSFDYDAMVAEADLIVDTRNAIKRVADNVFRLGAPRPEGEKALA